MYKNASDLHNAITGEMCFIAEQVFSLFSSIPWEHSPVHSVPPRVVGSLLDTYRHHGLDQIRPGWWSVFDHCWALLYFSPHVAMNEMCDGRSVWLPAPCCTTVVQNQHVPVHRHWCCYVPTYYQNLLRSKPQRIHATFFFLSIQGQVWQSRLTIISPLIIMTILKSCKICYSSSQFNGKNQLIKDLPPPGIICSLVKVKAHKIKNIYIWKDKLCLPSVPVKVNFFLELERQQVLAIPVGLKQTT